MNGIAVLVGE